MEEEKKGEFGHNMNKRESTEKCGTYSYLEGLL